METNVANEEILKAILKAVNVNDYIVNHSYLTSIENSMEPQILLKSFMVDQCVPMTAEEIQEKLPQFTVEIIKDLAYRNTQIFSVGNNRFFHIDCIQITKQELASMIQFVKYSIEKQGFTTGAELVKKIYQLHPHIVNNNGTLSASELRYALVTLLKEKFSVNGNIISTLDKNLNVWNIVIKYCESHDELTLDELDELRKSLSNATIPISVVYEYKIRLNENVFVRPNSILWDIARMDNAIERFCPNNYIPLRAIGKNDYPLLPGVEYPWTDYLLESYVYSTSKTFQLLHGSFNTNCCVGAIVRRTAGFQTFNELLVDALAHSGEELTENYALDYFCQEGYIARRRLKGIEQIVAQARIMRLKIKNKN